MGTKIRFNLDDLLIIAGAVLIIIATAQLSIIAALYVTGAVLIIFGVLIGLGGER